jgi:DNA mismatch repair ATPase MutS
MYYFVFSAIVILIIIGVLYIKAYYDKIRWAKKRLVKIQGKWGKPVDSRRNFDLIRTYLGSAGDKNKLSAQTSHDLDLVSVFNYIDRTNSKPGKQYLFNLLHHPTTDIDALHDLDNSVEDLNMDIPGRERLEVELSKLNSPDAYFIADLFLKEHKPVFSSVVNFYARVSPFLIIAALISLIVIPNIYSFIFLVLLFVYNIAIHLTSRKAISGYARSLPQLLIMYKVAVALVKSGKFGTAAAVKQSLTNLTGLKRALKFVNIESRFVSSTSDIGYAAFKLFKLLFVIEPNTYTSSLKQIAKYSADIKEVYEFIGRADTLIAIQSIRDGLPLYSKPEFTGVDGKIEVTELFHPLVANCVTNSLYTTEADRGALITGSNMAGKTTFIKALALNTLLSQTIFTSCAKAYKAPLLKIQTSIKTSDNIDEQKSYFQAQASAILNIIDNSSQKEEIKSLVIIDEIFRGTNTIERIAAAKSVLSYITSNQNFVFVSTHDLELAELLDEDFVVYSFSESKDGRILVFDYILKQGLLKNTNGIAILKSMGYPEPVIDEANIISERMMNKYLV